MSIHWFSSAFHWHTSLFNSPLFKFKFRLASCFVHLIIIIFFSFFASVCILIYSHNAISDFFGSVFCSFLSVLDDIPFSQLRFFFLFQTFPLFFPFFFFVFFIFNYSMYFFFFHLLFLHNLPDFSNPPFISIFTLLPYHTVAEYFTTHLQALWPHLHHRILLSNKHDRIFVRGCLFTYAIMEMTMILAVSSSENIRHSLTEQSLRQ